MTTRSYSTDLKKVELGTITRKLTPRRPANKGPTSQTTRKTEASVEPSWLRSAKRE
jgi:hypothetical protein